MSVVSAGRTSSENGGPGTTLSVGEPENSGAVEEPFGSLSTRSVSTRGVVGAVTRAPASAPPESSPQATVTVSPTASAPTDTVIVRPTTVSEGAPPACDVETVT